MTDRTDSGSRMPALYIGHGAPPLLDDALWSSQLAAWAQDLPRPKAILIVSAHWESAPVSLSATATGTPLIYDFGGFAPKYYNMQYVTPDASAFAARVAAMMPDTEPVHQHASRGLDHGAWVPLKIMYPAGDIPVLQMSLPTEDPYKLLELGRRLRPLRDEGVLIIGSGFLTHGLPFLQGVPDRGRGARLVHRVRRLGGRGPGPWRRRRAGVVPQQGAGHALRAPDRGALHTAVHHPRRGLGPRDARRPADRRLLDGPLQAQPPGRLTPHPLSAGLFTVQCGVVPGRP